ncbi:MAG TPA: hypothetical protein VLA74_02260 [Nitrososphaeraceae archaeon]|nr:hypothetical protein [Nitrososphaeraceae archaeon]
MTLIYFFIAIQFVYAQTVENEIIENTLESVENVTADISEIITESLTNTSESTDSNITSDTSKKQNQSEFKIYESKIIGVKFKMPSTWDIFLEGNNTKNCFDVKVDKIFISSYNECGVRLADDNIFSHPGFWVQITKHSTSNYSLADFLTHLYESIKHSEGFSFINDKEMTIQNHPAWQIEYRVEGEKQMVIVTKVNNTFYDLLYYPTYSYLYYKYLQEVENFVKSIEFIPSIEPKPLFLKYSTLKNTYAQTTTTNKITDLLFEKYYPIVKVAYESDSMVVLEAKENYLLEINGSFVPFWESIDRVKNQGYSLKEIITSGTGSIENPIIFYAIFFNNSNNKIEN